MESKFLLRSKGLCDLEGSGERGMPQLEAQNTILYYWNCLLVFL